MKNARFFGLYCATLLLLGFPSIQASAQARFRISVENTVDHVQTKAVERFAVALSERTEGRLNVEFYPEARLFRDRDVVPALVQGKVEMAVPGTWQLDRFEPSVGALLLPAFYGRDRDFVYRAFEGQLGREIERRLEESTGAVVLGRWIDLGRIHLFSVDKPIRSHEDIAGLNIRYAGGVVNEMRLAALGASPRLIPWPELRQRLRQGEVDGVLTSYETVSSAQLWEAGISHAFEDGQYFGRYVPLVSPQFWNRLPEDLRLIIRDTWEEHVDVARAEAAAAQDAARQTLEKNGITIVVPTEAEVAAQRQLLLRSQPDMMRALGLDSGISRLIPGPETTR